MSKIIYLKEGGEIKVSDYRVIEFKEEWVHIYSKDYRDCKTLETSIPVSNIKVIRNGVD